MSPALSSRCYVELTLIYDRLAPHYDRFLAPLERRFLSSWRAELMRSLPCNGRLLEVGAGTGRNAPLYPAASLAVATEPSGAMIRQFREKHGSSVRLVQCRAEALPFPDNSFDAALAALVLCSVASPALAFTEIHRVVRAGGIVALLEHVRPPGLLGIAFDVLSRLTVALVDDHFNRQTADAARAAGLEVLHIDVRARGIFQLIVCRV